MEKAVEANAAPPPYEPTPTQINGTAAYPTQPSGVYAPSGVTDIPPPSPAQGPNRQPIFLTARTCVYGPVPVEMDCPHCQVHIVTHMERVPGILPWIILAVCVVLGFLLLIPFFLCCVPFWIDAFLDVIHSCPACKRQLGRFSRI
ncbi:unnamed protein product, partial [Mesorhabditis spiculigera]